MNSKNKITILNVIGIVLCIIQFILIKSITSETSWKSYITAGISLLTIIVIFISNISSKKEDTSSSRKIINSIIRIITITISCIILMICIVLWL